MQIDLKVPKERGYSEQTNYQPYIAYLSFEISSTVTLLEQHTIENEQRSIQ